MNFFKVLPFLIAISLFVREIAISEAMERVERIQVNKMTRIDETSGLEVKFTQKIFGDLEETHQYEIGLYRIPVVHPYNPTGNSDKLQRKHFGVPTYLFMGKKQLVPSLKESPRLEKYVEEISNYLPALIKGLSNVSPLNERALYDTLELGVCVQNAPWSNDSLLLRPHYWAFESQGNIAQVNNFSQRKNVQALVLGPTGQFLEGQTNAGHLLNFSISIHATKNSLQIISSPHNMKIKNLQDNVTTYFWSFVSEGNKSCLTMHWLLSDHDLMMINQCEINSLESLMQNLSSYSKISFPKCNLSDQPHCPNLKYVLEYLKRNYPHSEFSTINDENKLLECACVLVNLGKFSPDSSALKEALRIIKIDS